MAWLKRAVLALAALIALGAGAAAAQVPDPFARELARELARADTALNEEGFFRAAGPFSGGLSSGEARTFPITLRAGRTYRIAGVCERRCGDFNLRAFGPDGAPVTQDVRPDTMPVLLLRPRATGVHRIEASMRRCRGQRCWYAINVYTR